MSEFDDYNWIRLCDALNVLNDRLNKNRENFISSDIELVTQALSIISSKINKGNVESCLHVATVCFRCLRSFCIKSSEEQFMIADDTLLQNTHHILATLYSPPWDDRHADCVAVGLQFLGNLMVNNSRNQVLIWNKFSTFLISAVYDSNMKVSDYGIRVLHNCLVNKQNDPLSVKDVDSLFHYMLNKAAIDSFPAFSVCTLFLKTEDLLLKIYHKLELLDRLLVLDVVQCMIPSSFDATEINLDDIPVSSMKFIVREFKNNSDVILQLSSNEVVNIAPEEVIKFLEVIASASGLENWLFVFQDDTSLLVNCLYLLKSIHSLGKAGHEEFSIVQKLSELSLSSRKSEVHKSPAYGFKADLVRLVGNLCWKHRGNQDKIREMDGIPLLLDCCNIDAKNPFILQWCIFAISNVLKNNVENQAVVASMNQQGMVNTSFLLEAGIRLHGSEDGNEILIAPYSPT